jgi:hypothetical protein
LSVPYLRGRKRKEGREGGREGRRKRENIEGARERKEKGLTMCITCPFGI